MSTHNPTRRDFLQAGTSASLGALITSSVGSLFAQATQAQTPPPQLRVLCTGPAGSIPDIVARRITEQLAQNYPQGAIVDNKPGAAGQIAMAALKAAPADGSTMLLAQGALATIYPYLYNKLANAGSPGQGTLPHLLQAMLFGQAEVPWQHIIYPGGP